MKQGISRKWMGGFTLVEISIVLVIIALITVAVLGGSSLIESAKSSNLVAVAKDLSGASIAFREKYKYWPGDLPLAGNSIQNLPAACNMATATANIGNGVIDTATEISCATEELFQAGMIRAELLPGDVYHTISVDSRPVRLIDAASSNVPNFPAGTNVVEFAGLRCEQVRALDQKIDDNNIDSASTGRGKSSVAACVVGGASDPVPFYAVALH